VLVRAGVVRDGIAPGDCGRNDGLDPALDEQSAEVVGVVASIGNEPSERPCGIDQVGGQADVIGIAATEQQNPRASLVVGQSVQLCGSSAARAAYPLEEVPPFAPAAQRCALTWVASIDAEL
jgi:hypothetical protein